MSVPKPLSYAHLQIHNGGQVAVAVYVALSIMPLGSVKYAVAVKPCTNTAGGCFRALRPAHWCLLIVVPCPLNYVHTLDTVRLYSSTAYTAVAVQVADVLPWSHKSVARVNMLVLSHNSILCFITQQFMGFSPYYCVHCHTILDNGWGAAEDITRDKARLMLLHNPGPKSGRALDDPRMTFTLCPKKRCRRWGKEDWGIRMDYSRRRFEIAGDDYSADY
jgi:hypothetical protein